MKTKQKRGVGRPGSFAKGVRGDATHAQALASMGYPARAQSQAAGLGRQQVQEIQRLMRAYDCDEEEALKKMEASGTFQTAPTDINCPLLEPAAHLESKFYREPQWGRRTVMEEWRAQVHRDARPHQLPVVLHSWDYCREPLVIVFPRGAHQGWHMFTLGEWIITLERSGYVLRDQRGQAVVDPATGRQCRARLRPIAGAATPVKQAALLTVHPAARLDAARWARESGGDYAVQNARDQKQYQEEKTWFHTPDGQQNWQDYLVTVGHPGMPQLDDLDQLVVNSRQYNVVSLRPMFECVGSGLRLSLIPASNAVPHGLAPGNARDYGRPRGVRVLGDYIYDQDDLQLLHDANDELQRGPGGELLWQVQPGTRPVALTSALAWLTSA